MYLSRLAELLYPARCPVCDKIIPYRHGIVCETCQNNLPYIRESYCLKCGKKLYQKEAELCADCSRMSHEFEENRALFPYDEKIRRSLYRLKYANRREHAILFARLAGSRYEGWIRRIGADCIIPVPLHKKRLRKRGYNQAALFARELAKGMQLPCLEHSAERIRATLPQKGLNPAERQKNLKKAFKIRQNDVKSKIVLLVDDIYTTGSTLDALAGECKRAGAEKVYCLTISIGRDRAGRESL